MRGAQCSYKVLGYKMLYDKLSNTRCNKPKLKGCKMQISLFLYNNITDGEFGKLRKHDSFVFSKI